MSGIVGSNHNIRGSGVVAKLGTDGQVFTSAGAGVKQTFEAAAGGGLDWQSVTTGTTLTAAAGNGYPINTTSNICTVTLPAGSTGDTIVFTDYAGTWDTYKLFIEADGSEKIEGVTSAHSVSDNRTAIELVYIDATQGWCTASSYVGGTSQANKSTGALTEIGLDWLLIAGGGGGGYDNSGGGGAGGMREGTITYAAGVTYTIVIGAGGAGVGYPPGNASSGVDSTFIGTGVSFTCNGGGFGQWSSGTAASLGGSGGGGSQGGPFGTGNEGDFDPVEGYRGGSSAIGGSGGAGGGGAGGQGDDIHTATGTDSVGNGGPARISSITETAVYYAGGGGGGSNQTEAYVGVGGATGVTATKGGGATGSASGATASAATANTGGGGGGGGQVGTGSTGGSGIFIVKIKDAEYASSTGSPTVDTSTNAAYTILTFNANGTFTTA